MGRGRRGIYAGMRGTGRALHHHRRYSCADRRAAARSEQFFLKVPAEMLFIRRPDRLYAKLHRNVARRRDLHRRLVYSGIYFCQVTVPSSVIEFSPLEIHAAPSRVSGDGYKNCGPFFFEDRESTGMFVSFSARLQFHLYFQARPPRS